MYHRCLLQNLRTEADSVGSISPYLLTADINSRSCLAADEAMGVVNQYFAYIRVTGFELFVPKSCSQGQIRCILLR